MTPGKTIIQDLQNYCNDLKEAKEGNYQFSHELEKLTFRINVKDFDKFSFVLKTLQVEHSNDVEPNVLKRQVEFLKNNLTYLLENIETFEIDELNLKAQLRSNVPHKDNSSLSYYEIIIEGGKKISLERVDFNKQDKQRPAVPFHVTNEVLERTINDFVKAIQMN